jgi:hypothetical protein
MKKTKLLIIFDQAESVVENAISRVDRSELEIVRFYGHGEKKDLFYKQDLDVKNIEIKNQTLADNFKEFYEQDCFKSELAQAFLNTIHINTVRQINNVLYTIKEYLSSAEMKEIYLLGGNSAVEFFSVFYAEGEVPFQLLYKKHWSRNYYISKFFSQMYPCTWLGEEGKLKLRLYKFIRRNVLILPKLFYYQLLRLLYFKYRRINKTDKELVFFSIRSTSQIATMEALFKGIPDKYQKVFFSNDLIQSPGISKLINKVGKSVSVYPGISLINSLQFLFKLFVVPSIVDNRTLRFLPISQREVNLELMSTYDEYILKKESLLRILKSAQGRIKVFLSSETYGQTSVMEKQVCDSLGIEYVNIQNVIYEYDWIPYFPIADKTFLFSSEVDFFEKKGALYYEVVGPVWLDQFYGRRDEYQKERVIGVFTQPDSYSKLYLELVEYISSNKEIFNDFVFVVKPHPRERRSNIDLFNDYAKGSSGCIQIADKRRSSIDLLKGSFATISISSTVLYESNVMGIPSIGFNPEGKHQDYSNNYDHLKDEHIFTIFHPRELIQVLRLLKSNSQAFEEKRRNTFKNLLCGYNGNAIERIIKVCNL